MWLHWEEEQSGLVIPMSNFEVLRGDLGLPDSQPFPPGLWLALDSQPFPSPNRRFLGEIPKSWIIV